MTGIAAEIERLREELAMLKRAKFCDEETIAEQSDKIGKLRAELDQAPDELLAHDNSQLRAEIDRLRNQLALACKALRWSGEHPI